MEQFEKIMKEHSMMREQIQTLTKEIEIWREACQQQEARNYDWLYDAKVINVVDGDTFDAEVMVGFDITVTLRFRLSGVDTPEIHGVPRESQEWQAGQRAFKRVKELLEGHVVTLETIKDKKGKYGRYLAKVKLMLNGEQCDLSSLLLTEGLAKPYEKKNG